MKKIYFILPLLFLHGYPVTAGEFQRNDDFIAYKTLNDSETRLNEFRDNDDALRLKIEQLALINSSRKKAGAQPVKLDILASRVANRMAKEAATNGFVSHWNLAGEKPYHRYAFAGGYDHVSENAYGEWTDGSYDITNRFVAESMKSGHQSFMKEKAPYDGHKKNIIDKAHNYVGIGYYSTRQSFSYYEEFINRYLDFSDIPSVLAPGQQSSITVDTRGESYLYYIIVYREPFPVARKVSQLKKTGSYDDFTNETYLQIPAWDLAKFRKGSRYVIPVSFSKEGLYYIQIYTDKKENTGQMSVSTKGKPPVSGIVISVKGR